jgi:hypothetical protein
MALPTPLKLASLLKNSSVHENDNTDAVVQQIRRDGISRVVNAICDIPVMMTVVQWTEPAKSASI